MDQCISCSCASRMIILRLYLNIISNILALLPYYSICLHPYSFPAYQEIYLYCSKLQHSLVVAQVLCRNMLLPLRICLNDEEIHLCCSKQQRNLALALMLCHSTE